MGTPLALIPDKSSAIRGAGFGVTSKRRLSTADTNNVNVLAVPCMVYGWYLTNNNAAARFVKLYNQIAAPVLATDVPVMTLEVPPNGIPAVFSTDVGISFNLGLSIAITAAVADTDATAVAAGEIITNIFTF